MGLKLGRTNQTCVLSLALNGLDSPIILYDGAFLLIGLGLACLSG
jgi:hypothetical protein